VKKPRKLDPKAFPDRPSGLLDFGDYGWIEGMDFHSRRISQDLYSGRHRSTLLGGCTEFSEHRPYHRGDSLRQMDWRLLAKRDRHFIKRFEDERTVSSLLVIDRSGSMGFGNEASSKYLHALRAAACLARLLLGHRDPVGLASWDAAGDGLIVRPKATPSHFEALFDEILKLPASGPSQLFALVLRLIPLFPARMRIMIFTDAFMDGVELQGMLSSLSARGHEVILAHVLAPEELEFSFSEATRFVDLEADDDYLDIDPVVYRESYLKSFNAFLEETMAHCVKLGCGYVRLVTRHPAGASLAAFLRRWNAGGISPVLGPDFDKTKPVSK